MKNKKYLVLISALLCLLMFLSACSSPKPQEAPGEELPNPEDPMLDKIFDPSFDYGDNRVSSMTALDVLGSFQPSSNEYFSIFKNEEISYIYSNTANKVICELDIEERNSDTATSVMYYFEGYIIPTSMPNIIAVIRYGAYNTGYTNLPELNGLIPTAIGTFEVTVEFYDAMGNMFHSLSNKEVTTACPDQVNIVAYINSIVCAEYGETNLFSVGNSVFSMSRIDGSVAHIKTYELTSIPAVTMMSELYYYVIDNIQYSVGVYDRALNRVATFILSSELFDNPSVVFPLPNGNLLFQHKKLLSSDSESYDFKKTFVLDTARELRYDLVTTVIDIQNNEIYIENPGFVILDHLYSFSDTDALIGTEYYSKMYNLTIDTVVKIAYIDETKELITDPAHTDVVALTNNCTVLRSLILNKDWISLPLPIANDLYDVVTVNGEHITVDRIGNVLFNYDSSKVTNLGKLSVGSGAIYDRTTGNAIFTLSANTSVIRNAYNKTIFITEDTPEGNTLLYAVLAGGTVEPLGATDGPAKSIEKFYLGEFGGYYSIKKLDSNEYEYFNEYGERIGASAAELTFITKVTDGYILADTVNGKYYKLASSGIALPNLYMSK